MLPLISADPVNGNAEPPPDAMDSLKYNRLPSISEMVNLLPFAVLVIKLIVLFYVLF